MQAIGAEANGLSWAADLARRASGVDPVARVLSAREREVIALLADGLSNRSIAEQLVISERTAENHIRRMLGKLGLQTRTQLAVWAVEHGLVAQRAH